MGIEQLIGSKSLFYVLATNVECLVVSHSVVEWMERNGYIRHLVMEWSGWIEVELWNLEERGMPIYITEERVTIPIRLSILHSTPLHNTPFHNSPLPISSHILEWHEERVRVDEWSG